MLTDIVIGMAGSGGDGVVAAGESMMTAVALDGYFAMLSKSFGPQIRGGESSFRMRMAVDPVLTPGSLLDVAIALNWDDFLKFGSELPIGGQTVVIYDSSTGVAADKLPLRGVSPAESRPVAIEAMARDTVGTDKAKNTVVLGLLAGWLGIARERMLAGLKKRFEKKGADIVERNERAFAAGLEHALEHPLRRSMRVAPSARAAGNLVADGNDMCAAGALFAGCTFFGGYPITPSSEIMHGLNREIWKYDGVMVQCEDEIAGVGACVGASFAGRKALTATSGPGMSLKTEMLGLATIAELPLVCVNVQRGGPSTGIPTKSEQSDLFQAVFSAHGDAMRPVLAPTTVADAFLTTIEAFNISERYQTPVVILSDQDIGQRKESFERPDVSGIKIKDRLVPAGTELEPYIRFRLTESGVSPISHPGMPGGNYLASGIEHTERGAPTASGDMHARMNDKRMRKLLPLKNRRDLFASEGPGDAPIGLVAWGSLAGVAIEARRLAEREGLRVKVLVPRLLYPVAELVYQDFFRSVLRGLIVEQSHQGQLHRLIRMFVDVPRGLESLCRSGSNPILVEEVVDLLKRQTLALQRESVPVEQEIG